MYLAVDWQRIFVLILISEEVLFHEMHLEYPITVAPCYYAASDITRSVVDPEFLPPGKVPNGPA